MGSLHFIRKNLGRKKLRTLFSGLSIVVAFLLFGLLGAVKNAFNLGVDLAAADRLISIHKVSLIQLLPISYLNRIAQIDGVEAVTHQTWFGGYHQDPKQQIPSFPTQPERLLQLYDEWIIDDTQQQNWLQNRTGALVGKTLADSKGWNVGDRIPIGSTIWPQSDGNRSWEFTIEAIFQDGGSGANEQAIYFHYDYFDEARQFGKGLVGWYIIRVSDPALSPQVATAVDAMTANSPAETKTTDEKAWVSGFAKQFGNIGLMITVIMGIVFFTMLLVSGNTMSQSVRERTSELAVLKTIGFSDQRILRMVLGESLLLSVVAGLIGLGLAAVMVVGVKQAMASFLPGIAFTNATLITGVVLAILFGLITGALPAIRAMRLNVVTALARR